MKKSIFAVLLCLLSLSPKSFAFDNIAITEVVDGDTLRAEIHELPYPLNKVSIRVLGIDTPEIHGKCQLEKEKAQEAKQFLSEKLKETKHVTLSSLHWDKYGGRILAEVYFDGVNISKLLIDEGLAVPYWGQKKTMDWCSKS
jgi:micrococcal nuclease